MALKWNCLEPLTAIGIGVGACAMAPIDAGLTAGAVIGGAGLFSRLKQNSRKAGLDDEKLVARVQKKLLGELKHWDQAEERAAAERADAAMQTLLPQVMLRRDQLAATVTQARERDERYPVLAARLVVDELARHDAMFEQPRAGALQRYERVFALEAVEAALRSGLDDPDYATLLTLDIAIELGAAIRETIDAIQVLHDKVERGFTALQEELAEIKAQGRGDDAKLARLSEKAMRGAVARFVAFSPRADTEEIVDAVEEFAEDYERLRVRVRKLEAEDNRMRGLQQSAEQALDVDGDIEEARRLLREATALRREAALGPVTDAAETQAALAEADLAALNWETAAANWRAATVMLSGFDAKGAGELGNVAGVELAKFGEKFGGGALEAAVTAFRQVLEIRPRDQLPIHWATTQNNLGAALRTQGARLGGQEGIDLLGEAVAAYRAALEVYTRDQFPVRWAATQNNLGNALATQGERLGGQEAIDLLGEAVAAYRAALEVRVRDQLPVPWALTQNNLGTALETQGARLGGQEGIDLLGEAVAAYRAALEVYTRDQFPVPWAATQNNLGAALATQGERLGGKEGIDLLGEAVAAYRAALEIRVRDQLPVPWATTQNNLGNALATQGKRLGGQEGIVLLGQAVVAYRSALEVYTRDQFPVPWAATQNNLGAALRTQGERLGGQEGIDLLGEAVAAYRAALEVRARDQLPVQWGATQNNLGIALATKGARLGGQEGIDLLSEAVAAYCAVLEVYTRDQRPVDWAMTNENLAITLIALGEEDVPRRCEHYRMALESVEDALTVYTAEHMPYDHGTATDLRARIAAKIAEHCSDD